MFRNIHFFIFSLSLPHTLYVSSCLPVCLSFLLTIERIARHYKFSLSQAFNRKPDAAAVIIVEDDLLFSPDFYEYFNYVAPILDLDKSLFVISAWNDNGFKGKVEDSLALRRTEFFPGLGWLLPKTLYKVVYIAFISIILYIISPL